MLARLESSCNLLHRPYQIARVCGGNASIKAVVYSPEALNERRGIALQPWLCCTVLPCRAIRMDFSEKPSVRINSMEHLGRSCCVTSGTDVGNACPRGATRTATRTAMAREGRLWPLWWTWLRGLALAHKCWQFLLWGLRGLRCLL